MDTFADVVERAVVLEGALYAWDGDVGLLGEEMKDGGVCLPALRVRRRRNDKIIDVGNRLPFMSPKRSLDTRIPYSKVLLVSKNCPTAGLATVVWFFVGDHHGLMSSIEEVE